MLKLSLHRVEPCTMNREDESACVPAEARVMDGYGASVSMERLGLESAGMLHDLSNSLQIVISNLELAARAPGNGQSARHLALARIGVDRCLGLARRTLARGRNSGTGDVLAMHEVLPRIAECLRCAAGAGIALEITVNGDDLAIEADEAELESALLNLVLNARDAMDGRGRILISCGPAATFAPRLADRERGMVVLRVEDTGPGIPADCAHQVTRPFFTTKLNGTGLGLFNVRTFVEAARGGFAIDTAPGLGTAVTLSFPSAARAG